MAGDGPMQSVQQEAMTLLRVVLSCPVGAQRAVYDYQGGKSYSRLLARKKKEEELYTKCVKMEAEINLLKGDKQTFNAVEDRSERIGQLKMEITEVKAKHYQDTLLLALLKKSQYANKVIFSHKHSELDTSDDLRSILEQQSEVVTELMKNFKKVESRRTEIIDNIRTQRSMVQNECRKLMSHLQQQSVQKSSTEDKKAQAVQEMEEKLKEVTSRTTLLQHTLQALFGGCTNWAADEELHEFLISLGAPLVP